MTLFSKRNRMVSIRLSDDEFRKLHEVCVARGARSISDLARDAMHRMIAGTDEKDDRLGEVRERLSSLEAEVARLSATVGGGK